MPNEASARPGASATQRTSQGVVRISVGSPVHSGHQSPVISHLLHSWLARVFALMVVLVPLGAAAPVSDPGGGTTVSTALSILSTPKLPADFPYFPYVNPEAPKGGSVRLAAIGTFDSFNPFILRGTAVAGLVGSWVILPGGSGGGSEIGHIWESMFASSSDEASTGYCHLCKTIEQPADHSWIAFTLRPDARFSDGVPVTSADIVWTFSTLMKQGSPSFRLQLAAVQSVTADGPERVVYHFRPEHDRKLPLQVGFLPVLPEHFFKGKDFTQPLAVAPVGSGPYTVQSFELGRYVVFARNPNWWARDLPTARGLENFGSVRVDYYRDSSVVMEAFKAGQFDIRSENIAKNWATAYDFPAVANGLVIRREVRHHLPTGLQGWFMNTRRAVFKDPLVRQAIAEAYDFQWADRTLFYNAYTRTTSYFENSDLAATGLPDAAEQALLAPFRAELPRALFTEPFTLPVTDGSGHNLPQLKKAMALLEQAGWTVRGMKLVNAAGEQMHFTLLLDEPTFERIALPFVQTLKRLGIAADVRTVDPAQFQHLMENFEFDMTMMVLPENELPGSELLDFFSCASAKEPGSSNVSGICDPAVQALVGKILSAPDRAALREAARALDRVLLWRYYAVPCWGSQTFRIAYWNRFGDPNVPIRDGIDFDRWWVDPALAARTDAARRAGG